MNTTRFEIDESVGIVGGTLVYRKQDHAFDAEPRPTMCPFAIAVNELELMIDEDGKRIVFVTGYSPHEGWNPRPLSPPSSERGALYVLGSSNLEAGVTVRIK